MGALLSKSGDSVNNKPKPKSAKSKPAKLNPGPHLNRTADNNTTDMTTLPDDSQLTVDADADPNCSAVSMHTASDVSFAISASEAASDPATPAHRPSAALQFIDPRSPFVCRTPLQAIASSESPTAYAITKQLNLSSDQQRTPSTGAANNWLAGGQKTFVQQKLLKNLGYQEFDPRSPTQFINRTPMRLGDGVVTKMAVAAEADVAAEVTEEALSESLSSVVGVVDLTNTEITESQPEVAEIAPVDVEQQVAGENGLAEVSPAKLPAADVDDSCDSDPRSPSINVDRTPIVLLSSAAAVADNCENVPAVSELSAAISAATAANQSSIQIFEDDAVIACSTMLSTPSKSVLGAAKKTGDNPRTPLSCLGNQKGLGRMAASAAASGRKPQHPILFIGKHQSTAAAASRNGADSRIPVLKSAASGGNSMLKMEHL